MFASGALVWGVEPGQATLPLDYEQLSTALNVLQEENPDLIHVYSLCKSAENRELWVAEVGLGTEAERAVRPGMLVVAGIEGNRPAGTNAAVAFLDSLCESRKDSGDIGHLLETTSIYVIPRLNPDAAERYFMRPQMEFVTNTTPSDADHDGLTDEDGPDDLNGDGFVVSMRVEDPKGTYVEHPEQYGIMVEADPAKGEHGRWLLLAEGVDNDADEEWNEDPLGGVDLNRNFPFDYPWFEPTAGIHQICERETRALADFVIAHPNIAVVMTFAGNSTLLKKPESGERTDGRSPQTKIRNEDVDYYGELGEKYRELLAIEKEIETDNIPGSFVDWIYFHRGRLSLSAPLWSAKIAVALKTGEDEGEKAEKPEEDEDSDKQEDSEKKKEKKIDERAKTERDYLKWVEKNAPDRFLPWTAIDHPDYPGQRVEVGGFAPFAMTVPPSDRLADIVKDESDFLIELAKRLPRIVINDIEIKNLGEGVFDITIYIVNEGYLPTVLAHGERTGEVLPTRLVIGLPDESILAGRNRWKLGPIKGGESIERRCVVKTESGKTVDVEVVSALAGRDRKTIVLGEK